MKDIKKTPPLFLSVAAVALFVVVFYAPVFFSDKTVSPFDICYFKFPAFEELKPAGLLRPSNNVISDPVNQFQPWDIAAFSGIIDFPYLWNPYNGCATPFFANGQSALLFPLKFIAYNLSGVKRGFGFLCILKTLLAGVFMLLYLRNLGLRPCAVTVGSLGFMCCGFMIVWLQYPLANAALFLPLLFLGCDLAFQKKGRLGCLVLTAGTACSFLGGHPETTVHCLAGVFFYALVLSALRVKRLRRQEYGSGFVLTAISPISITVAGIALGILIAAVQIVPTAEYILNSEILQFRAELPELHSSLFAFDVSHLSNLYRSILFYLSPNTWGNPSIHDTWWWGSFLKAQTSGYIGAGLLLLSFFAWAFVGRIDTITALCFVQVLALCFVAEIPFVTETIGRVPPLSVAAKSREVLLFSFASSAMAAIAIDRIWLGAVVYAGKVRFWFWSVVAVCSGIVLYDYVNRFAFDPDPWMVRYGSVNLLVFFMFALPYMCIFIFASLPERLKILAGLFLVVLTAADLYTLQNSYNSFIRTEAVFEQPPEIAEIKKHIGPNRLLPLGEQFKSCMGLAYEVHEPRIYDAVTVAWYAEFLSHIGYVSIIDEFLPDFDLRFASLASIRYIWNRHALSSKNTPYLVMRYSSPRSALYENPHALPRAYVSASWETAATNAEAFALLSDPEFPWREKTVVETQSPMGRAPRPSQVSRPVMPAEVVAYENCSISIRLPDRAQGLLVLTDCFYPGWKAEVDGRAAQVYRVNGTFRGVFVDATDSHVIFRYRPYSVIAGLVVSCCASLATLCMCIFFWMQFRKRKSAGTGC